ncbi:hypothetical protein LR48_Vigan07g211300 [Vigna angularis]|uniref:Myb-like domain-containing protein n=1 Tax=Phaseolus angularis TaxID=3914 RepID=A0A0L9V0X7_PHAAN|nr:hypothetical protein LR48_Vigan07g211300 [Vigna angularis]
MKIYEDDDDSGSAGGFRCTRSQAAPDWSVIESLILVNEVAAVEADCSVALSSYQQWNIIAQNCMALDVQRNLAQCRRKWHALLSDYDRFKGTVTAGGKLPPNFDYELFEAVERVIRAREERGMADPESDTEAGNEARDATVEIGSKRKGQRSKFRHRIQKPKLEQRHEDSHEEEHEDDHSEDEYLKDYLESRPKLKCTTERPPKHSGISPKSLKVELHENHTERPKPITVEKIAISREENQETLTLKLQDLAVEIEAIATKSATDYKGGDSKNVEDSCTDFTRRQGDKLITSLGDFSNTLKQLCDILQECK